MREDDDLEVRIARRRAEMRREMDEPVPVRPTEALSSKVVKVVVIVLGALLLWLLWGLFVGW